MNISERLHELDSNGQFEEFEEIAIISIALDNPDYFISIHHLLNPSIFALPYVGYIINALIEQVNKYGVVPTRPALLKIIKDHLTTDIPWWEQIVDVVKRPASYRDIPIVKERLDGWVRRKQIDKLYAKEGTDAYDAGDFDKLIEIVESITRFNQVSYQCFSLVEDLDKLFVKTDVDHITTGFGSLDKDLNDGGPSAGEVLIYMGPTNVGKSILLCNTAKTHYRAGLNVLLVTLEMDWRKTAKKVLAPLTNTKIDEIDAHQAKLDKYVRGINLTHHNDLRILEWPPDEISVDAIYAGLQNLQRSSGFIPQSIIIDYMDLMVSSRATDNKDDYTRQKYVSYQIRALAKKFNCLVTTATQTNRSGNDISSGMIDLTKAAESYGKTMPVDYVVTINQDTDLHSKGKILLHIAKNRNGPKNVTVTCDIDYKVLSTKERV